MSLEAERGETLVLLGRSGSGKTTALRLVNRLLEPRVAKIYVTGRILRELDLIALRRKTGYVIQELGLLPHWTVEQNVALVPRLLDWPVEKQRARARELLKQVGLDRGRIGRAQAPAAFGRPAPAGGSCTGAGGRTRLAFVR